MMTATMEATVTWRDGLVFDGQSGTGHNVTMDGNKEVAASPMELVLMAAGGCSSVDVVSILQKARQQVVGVQCQVKGERADRSEEHTSELQSRENLVCRLLLEKK